MKMTHVVLSTTRDVTQSGLTVKVRGATHTCRSRHAAPDKFYLVEEGAKWLF